MEENLKESIHEELKKLEDMLQSNLEKEIIEKQKEKLDKLLQEYVKDL